MPSGIRPDKEVAEARAGGGFTSRGPAHDSYADQRQRMRAAGADFITPKYGWGDAQISDFGITGGLMNAFKGLIAGNTYAGRTPQGLVGRSVRDRLGRSGLYQGSQQGLMYRPPMAKLPVQSPLQGLSFKPQTYQPAPISIPGGSDYGVAFDPWKFWS